MKADVVAVVLILFLCMVAVAGCIALAMRSAEQHGWVSVRAIGSIAAALVLTMAAVWAVVVTFDAEDAGAQVGVENTNGNCDPACLLAVLGRTSGAAN